MGGDGLGGFSFVCLFVCLFVFFWFFFFLGGGGLELINHKCRVIFSE